MKLESGVNAKRFSLKGCSQAFIGDLGNCRNDVRACKTVAKVRGQGWKISFETLSVTICF